jgi:hypothetical protein
MLPSHALLQVKDCIEKARTYKIYEPHFEKTGSLLETGGDAAACTEHPVVVAYGTTPQLLVRFKTQEDIHSILTEHLRVQSSRWVGFGWHVLAQKLHAPPQLLQYRRHDEGHHAYTRQRVPCHLGPGQQPLGRWLGCAAKVTAPGPSDDVPCCDQRVATHWAMALHGALRC